MGRQGPVTGVYTGNRKYTGNISFTQAVNGFGLTTKGTFWYIDKNKTTGVSGDGKTWENAFMTFTEAIAAAGDNDVIFVAGGDTSTSYTEATELTITQDHLKIIGPNTTNGFETIYLGSPTAAGEIFIIRAHGVEICGLAFYITEDTKSAIRIGTAADATSFFGIHIHHCYCYAGAGEYFVNIPTNPDAPDLLIDNCKIQGCQTAAIKLFATRGEVRDCLIKPLAAKIGIDFKTRASFERIQGNVISGVNSTDTGIKIDSGSTAAGCVAICNNTVLNCGTIAITQDVGITNIACNNWIEATNGAFAGADSTVS